MKTIGRMVLGAALTLVGAGLVLAQTPQEAMRLVEGPQRPNRQGFDPWTVGELLDELGVPGVSVAVIRDFEIHWAKGYGIADVETGAAVTPDTLFQAASISKPVAAMAALKAVELDAFGLDADINTILESWKLPMGEWASGPAVTPRMLLSHSSGLGDGFGFPGYHPDDDLPTVIQILDGQEPSNVGVVRMERAPMSAYKYSGGGVTIMQLALEEALDEPFADALDRLVLEPLGMTNSAYEQPLGPERDRHAARAHDGSGEAQDAKWHVYPELQAAGLWTTPTDLARLAIEVQRTLRGESQRVLSTVTMREMVRPVGVGNFAVGFRVSKLGEGWYFGHTGSNWGFRCELIAHVAKGYGVAIMTNGDNGGPMVRELRERIARAYGWDTLDKPVPR